LANTEGEPAPSLPTGVSQTLTAVAALSGATPNDEGLMRILYHLDRELGAPVSDRGERGHQPGRAFLRVSIPVGRAAEPAVLWLEFLSARSGRHADTMALMPHGEAWVDLIVGEPTPSQLYCLRAAPAAVPLTSDIPYNIDPAFIERARGLLTASG